jgi:hypothetical protein
MGDLAVEASELVAEGSSWGSFTKMIVALPGHENPGLEEAPLCAKIYDSPVSPASA